MTLLSEELKRDIRGFLEINGMNLSKIDLIIWFGCLAISIVIAMGSIASKNDALSSLEQQLYPMVFNILAFIVPCIAMIFVTSYGAVMIRYHSERPTTIVAGNRVWWCLVILYAIIFAITIPVAIVCVHDGVDLFRTMWEAQYNAPYDQSMFYYGCLAAPSFGIAMLVSFVTSAMRSWDWYRVEPDTTIEMADGSTQTLSAVAGD